MKVNQISLTEENWSITLKSLDVDANLFILFVSPEFYPKHDVLSAINTKYPNATVIGCSTAGEISDVTVKDKTISLTAIKVEKTEFKKYAVQVKDMNCSHEAGEKIAEALYEENLKHVIVLSDGLNVNGADLVSGLKTNLPNVSITGGLAGDGSNFNETFIINDTEIVDKTIVGIGFYGDNLKVGYSSKGGWDSFGIERLVTKSDKNVLYELDGMPALEIYKSFLGEEANNLPSSGLLFPLRLRTSEDSKPVVRTILAVNEDDQSLVANT